MIFDPLRLKIAIVDTRHAWVEAFGVLDVIHAQLNGFGHVLPLLVACYQWGFPAKEVLGVALRFLDFVFFPADFHVGITARNRVVRLQNRLTTRLGARRLERFLVKQPESGSMLNVIEPLSQRAVS